MYLILFILNLVFFSLLNIRGRQVKSDIFIQHNIQVEQIYMARRPTKAVGKID